MSTQSPRADKKQMSMTWSKVKNTSYLSELATMRAIVQVIQVKPRTLVESTQINTRAGTMSGQDNQNPTGTNKKPQAT